MTTATTLLEGLYFGECPRWRDGQLWYSDFYAHAVFRVTPGQTPVKVVEVPNQPSGLGWLPDGRLLIVSMTDRKLLRLEGGALVEHADLNSLATFHCNDMVVDSAGRAYVGNFGFNLEAFIAERGAAAMAEAPSACLIRVDPDGSVHEAAADIRFPNGSVITPDGKTFILAETMGRVLTAFDIAPDGSLSNRRTWAETGRALPDGICLDAEGAIWIANPAAPECLRIAEGGEVLDRVETSQPSFACMLGGEDGKTLFIVTAPGSGSVAEKEPKGRIETARVTVGHAGLP